MAAESAQTRIDLAFRRLQIAFLRAGYEFDGTTLEAAVKRAARIVEDRADRDDNLKACDEPHEHWWTDWALNPIHGRREERFCFRCGSMEWQALLDPDDPDAPREEQRGPADQFPGDHDNEDTALKGGVIFPGPPDDEQQGSS